VRMAAYCRRHDSMLHASVPALYLFPQQIAEGLQAWQPRSRSGTNFAPRAVLNLRRHRVK
jgi:hypothetical protein